MAKQVRHLIGLRVNAWLLRRLQKRLSPLGQYVLIVPHWAHADVAKHLYGLSLARWTPRWGHRDARASLAEWRTAMLNTGRIPARFYALDDTRPDPPERQGG